MGGITQTGPIPLGELTTSTLARVLMLRMAAFTRVGNVITADANGAIQSQDTISLDLNDTVVVSNTYTVDGAETPSATDEGLYTVTALGDGSNPFVLTRHERLDSDQDLADWIKLGLEVMIVEGERWGEKGIKFRASPEAIDSIRLGTDVTALEISPASLIETVQGLVDLSGGGGYISGDMPSWQSVTTVRVPTGYKALDPDTGIIIEAAGNLDVVISASGALGLDTGSEAGDTWYYLWIISKNDDETSAMLSLSSTTPTMPAEYVNKSRLHAIRNDGSSNILKFASSWSGAWTVNTHSQIALSENPASASIQNVSLASYVPPTAKDVRIRHFARADNGHSGGGVIYFDGDDSNYKFLAVSQIGSAGDDDGFVHFPPSWVVLESINIRVGWSGGANRYQWIWYILGWKE